ncbi:NINE protein [Robiginitalea sp. IMCC44478]|uniref:NINE protein n=1 Tax=Robiginitalea sp. IMCC44478 TaxID=3459122 RepID=UPI00404228BF
MSEETGNSEKKEGKGFEKAKEKAREMGEEAKEAAGEFREEAKKTAEEFKEGFKQASGENKKILAGILAIVVGWAGIHKFVLGYQKEGIIMLVISVIGFVLSCIGIGIFLVWATGLIGLIEGIIYLTKSDEDFYNTYQVGRKPWF